MPGGAVYFRLRQRRDKRLFDRVSHDPQHERHALAQGLLLGQAEAQIRIPDAVNGRHGQGRVAEDDWIHDRGTFRCSCGEDDALDRGPAGSARLHLVRLVAQGFRGPVLHPPRYSKNSICAGRVNFSLGTPRQLRRQHNKAVRQKPKDFGPGTVSA